MSLSTIAQRVFRAVALAILFVNPGLAGAAIAFKQVNATTVGSPQSNVTVTYASAQSAGDLNVVVIGWEDSVSNVSSVTDSRGNTYSLAGAVARSSGNASVAVYYAKNIVAAAAGANTVTVTFSGSVPYPDVRIAEYSGIDISAPLEDAAGAAGSGTTNNSGSVTVVSSDALLVAGNMLEDSTTSAGTGFTSRVITDHSHILEDRIVSSPGLYSATANSNGGWWVMQVAAFKASTVSSDTTPPTIPAGPTATPASNSRIDLAWTASTDDVGVTSYRIERCQGAGCTTFAPIATVSGTTHADTGLSPGTTYRYRVYALDAAANVSGSSAVASATTQSAVPITFIQVNATTSGSPQSSVDATYTNAQSLGNLNVVVIGWEDSTANVTSVVDTAGNSYTIAGTPARSTGNATVAIYYAKNIAAAAAGANTVTVAFSGAVAFPDVRIAEYSGIDTSAPLEGASGAAGVGAVSDSGSVTTSANSLLVAGNMLSWATDSAGTNFTSRIITAHSHILEDRHVTSAGSYNATANGTNGWWVIQMAAFKGASGSADTTPPSAPTNLTATAASSSQITLTWAASTDNVAVTGYVVERCQGVGCSSFAQIAAPTTTSYNDTGLSPGISYSYRVLAKDAALNASGYSSTQTAVTQSGADGSAPTEPTGPGATAVSSTQVNVAWTASTDNVAVTGYEIQRCTGTGCNTFLLVGTSVGTSFSDTNRAPGTTYRYRIRAHDAVPNFSSFTSPVSVTTLADTEDPTVPTGLSAAAISDSQVNLSWGAATDNVGVTGYLIERCLGTGCASFTEIGAIGSTTTFADTTVVASSVYRYRVRARDAADNRGSYTNIAAATTPDSSGSIAGAVTYEYDSFGRLKRVTVTPQ